MIKIFLVIAALMLFVGGVVFFTHESVEVGSSQTPAGTENTGATSAPEVVSVPAAAVPSDKEIVKDSVKVVDLSSRGLTQVSAEVFRNTETEELNLAHNKLTGALPGEIRFFQNLRVLNLSHNQFTGVPAEIGQLKNLEVLDLSNNSITGLPNELGNLSNLKLLDLRGNAYAAADLEGIKQRLPVTTVIQVD